MRIRLGSAIVSLAVLCFQCAGDDNAGSGGASNAGGSLATGSGGSSAGSGGTSSGGGGSAQAGGTSASDGAASSLVEAGADGAPDASQNRDAANDVASNTASNDAAGDAALPYSPCPPVGQPCKILPLGDSITDGFTVLGGYRIELFRAAHAAGQNITFVGSLMNGPATVDGVAFPRSNEGHNGFTIADAPAVARTGIAGMLTDTAMRTFTPHIVTLAIGTNDVDTNNDLANASARLAALMDQIIAANANVLLVVAQIIPTGTDAENVRIQAYNAAIPALVQARASTGKHVMLVDMYSAFMANPNFRSLLADNLHPNATGYTVMGQVWYHALANIIH